MKKKPTKTAHPVPARRSIISAMIDRLAHKHAPKIWHPANVYPTARLSNHTSVGAFAEVGDGVIIGEGTRIGMGVFIPAGVVIGKRCFISPRVTFCNDLYPKVGNPKSSWEKTTVQDDVSIGANSTILCGITLHKGCMIGCGSVVIKSVPAGEIHAGNPARKIGII